MSILGHIKDVHAHMNMSIEDYREKYMDNYVEKETAKTLKLNGSTKTDADFSWINQCIFKCALCEKELLSRRSFRGHLHSLHNLSIGEYGKDHTIEMSKEKKHSCQMESCDAVDMDVRPLGGKKYIQLLRCF